MREKRRKEGKEQVRGGWKEIKQAGMQERKKDCYRWFSRCSSSSNLI